MTASLIFACCAYTLALYCIIGNLTAFFLLPAEIATKQPRAWSSHNPMDLVSSDPVEFQYSNMLVHTRHNILAKMLDEFES